MAQLSRDTGLHPATLRALRDNAFKRVDVDTALSLCDYFCLSAIEELFAISQD